MTHISSTIDLILGIGIEFVIVGIVLWINNNYDKWTFLSERWTSYVVFGIGIILTLNMCILRNLV